MSDVLPLCRVLRAQIQFDADSASSASIERKRQRPRPQPWPSPMTGVLAGRPTGTGVLAGRPALTQNLPQIELGNDRKGRWPVGWALSAEIFRLFWLQPRHFGFSFGWSLGQLPGQIAWSLQCLFKHIQYEYLSNIFVGKFSRTQSLSNLAFLQVCIRRVSASCTVKGFQEAWLVECWFWRELGILQDVDTHF